VLLAIDVGNTETKLGCFDGNDLKYNWRVRTESRRTADEYGVFFTQLFATQSLKLSNIEAIVVSSVVPSLDHTLVELCERFFHRSPRFLDPSTQTLIPIRTDQPAGVGADLVAAAIGGREKYGAPLIVVSYGTASAFIAISSTGAFLGAAIAPGIRVSIDALIGRTAKLPQVTLEEPEHAIGRHTVEALRSGLIYGFVGQSEAIVARMRAELGEDVRVVATGGNAEVIVRHSTVITTIDPYLNLNGLRLFYQSQR